MSQDFFVIIPARYGAARLPGKPLLEIGGRPLLWHAHRAARQSAAAQVIIATDDERIARAARRFADPVVMTSAAHRSGTERIAEAAARLDLPAAAVIVNVQGDAFGLPPQLVNQAAQVLREREDASMVGLYAPIRSAAELHDPNVVKAVADAAGRALLFSRAPIPWHGPAASAAVAPIAARRHLGLYAYARSFLDTYAGLPACDSERVERLEQLRALHHGFRIYLAPAAAADPGLEINTPEDLGRARAAASGAA